MGVGGWRGEIEYTAKAQPAGAAACSWGFWLSLAKRIWLKIIWVRKKFGSNKLLGQQKFCVKKIWKRIFVDTVSTNKNYAVDTVSTNKSYAIDTLCTNSAF